LVLAAIVSLITKKLSLTVRVSDEMDLGAVRNPTPEQYLILTLLKQTSSPNRASNLLYKQRIRPNGGSATTHKRNPTPEQYLILTVLKQISSPNRASNLLYKQRIRPNGGSATTHKPKIYCCPKRFERISKGV
jgi:hypothetical protein